MRCEPRTSLGFGGMRPAGSTSRLHGVRVTSTVSSSSRTSFISYMSLPRKQSGTSCQFCTLYVLLGNSVRCPYHAWQFDRTGACTRIEYSKKIPKKARVA